MHIVANILIGLSAIAVVFVGARFLACMVSAESARLVRRQPGLHVGLFLAGLAIFYVLQVRPAMHPYRRRAEAPGGTRQTAATVPASPSTKRPLSAAKLVNVGRSEDGRWYVTVVVTNPLSVPVDCSLYVAADPSTRSALSTGPAAVEWSRLPPDQAGKAPFSMYPPMMGYRYGLSGPVVQINPSESAELRALTGWVSPTNENLLVILYRPQVSPEPKGTDLPVLAARLPKSSSAEHTTSR